MYIYHICKLVLLYIILLLYTLPYKNIMPSFFKFYLLKLIVAHHPRSLQPHWSWLRCQSSLSFSIDNTLDWVATHPGSPSPPPPPYSLSSSAGQVPKSSNTQPKPIQPCRQLHRLSSTPSQSRSQSLSQSISQSLSHSVSLSIQVRNFLLAVDLSHGSRRSRRGGQDTLTDD